MRRLKGGVIAALVLVSALVVVASPAFATPNITASSGTRSGDIHRDGAVSPFITPSTNTRSQITARSTNSRFSLPSLGTTLACRTSSVSGYASTTHTQLRLTSVSFGDDQNPGASNCTATGGTLAEPITCTATSARPWFLHVKNIISGGGARGSASGTVNLTSSCVVTVRLAGLGTQQVTVDANQSCIGGAATDNTYTWDTTSSPVRSSLSVRCRLRVTIQPINITTTGSLFEGDYTARPDTVRDPVPSVTLAS